MQKSRHLRLAAIAAAAVFSFAAPVRAEMSNVRVATQIGLPYLPLIVMQSDKLWEEEAKKRGVDVTVEYARLGGGGPLNDALLSDSVQIASAGLAPMLTLWDKTSKNYGVKGLSAINASPMYLLTNNPNIKSIKDFGPNDRIALPSIKVSIQAIVLAMGVEQAFGPGKSGELDNIQVAMAHPEAYAALTSKAGGITGYMASSPFQERALKVPGITKVADSFQIQGGPATLSVIYAKSDFVKNNPKLVEAFMAAQRRAVDLIKTDLKGSIDKYYAVTGDKTDRAIVEQILSSPEYDFDIYPKESMKIADFMYRTGALKQKPTSWKDYFFETVHSEKGN
ncbi:ABC transporter substrate-binding protein [Aquabacter sp. L1I39]|uniref:ABC transporter substrate-binding protein n=1 Tax=Aquabacter sp. L1I39 TaxID=2820278 RepID=UPI001ADC7922|nr:ABC transporter substrate-binding protein [Aquabacter sp. L1I39]QTL05679.1 ABC transporter substrate-binding protein [Aquabacter sp. L1I39]